MRPKFVALVAVSTLALSGCSSAAEPAPEPTDSAAPAARQAINPPSSASDDEDEAEKEQAEDTFLVEYKQVGGITELYGEEELIQFGYDACEIVKRGGSVPLNKIGETGDDHSVAITTEMAAKVTLCPEAAN